MRAFRLLVALRVFRAKAKAKRDHKQGKRLKSIAAMIANGWG